MKCRDQSKMSLWAFFFSSLFALNSTVCHPRPKPGINHYTAFDLRAYPQFPSLDISKKPLSPVQPDGRLAVIPKVRVSH